jgi:hypothetical protein
MVVRVTIGSSRVLRGADPRGIRLWREAERAQGPEVSRYGGKATHLQDVWIAVRATLREVLEHVTLGQVLRGDLPEAITRFSSDPEAWTTRHI